MVHIVNVKGNGLSDLVASFANPYYGTTVVIWGSYEEWIFAKRPNNQWEAIYLPNMGRTGSIRTSWDFGPHLFA